MTEVSPLTCHFKRIKKKRMEVHVECKNFPQDVKNVAGGL